MLYGSVDDPRCRKDSVKTCMGQARAPLPSNQTTVLYASQEMSYLSLCYHTRCRLAVIGARGSDYEPDGRLGDVCFPTFLLDSFLA